MVWEYKTIVQEVRSSTFDLQGQTGLSPDAIEPVLNQLGMEQWELVSSNTVASAGHTKQILYFLKRPLMLGRAVQTPDIGFDIDQNGLTGSQR
jgi:hypothetical protein